MKVFVDNVAAQAVEACLLAHLSEVLSPASILEMPADLITAIAGEPEDCQVEREQLTRKLAVLKSGLDICKRYATRPIRGTIPKVADHGVGAEKTKFSEPTPQLELDGAADSRPSSPPAVTPPVSADDKDLWSFNNTQVEEPMAERFILPTDWDAHVGSASTKGKSAKNRKRYY